MRLLRTTSIKDSVSSTSNRVLALLAAALLSLMTLASVHAGAPEPAAPPASPTELPGASHGLVLAQEYPAPPFYLLLPHDYPYPLIRTCYTSAGICAIPFTIQPGTPCYCEASSGVRVDGVCTK